MRTIMVGVCVCRLPLLVGGILAQWVFALGFAAIVGVGVATKLGYFARFQEDGDKRTAMMAAPGPGAASGGHSDHEMQQYTAA
jgi:hypothetical protein|eukprot:COSAG06_NODE_875_length_11812_cov_5.166539_6_plen_83_part_00